MFFKLTVFKKMLKEAYKHGGLTVNRTTEPDEYDGIREGIYLQGDFWAMWIDLEAMPKEAKATVVELCGELPALEQPFTAQKDYGNQYEIKRNDFMNLLPRAKAAKEEFKISSLIFIHKKIPVRMIQHIDTKHIVTLDEMFINLIDIGSISTEAGEFTPLGPLGWSEEGNILYWWNHHCCLMALPRRLPDEETEEYEYIKRMEQWQII